MSAPSWCHSAGILGGGGCSRTFRRWWALDKRPQTSIGEPDQRLSEEVPAGDEFDSAFADRTADRALPTTASKCAAATVFPSDAPVAYNHAYGVLIRGEGRFPLTGNYTTTIQRPTVLSWAFSFVDSARHAGLPAILRVPAARCLTATTRPVRPCSALSSLETYANFFAVALAEGVVHQPLVRVPTRMVASRVCTSNAERQTREASIHVSPWAGTGRHRSCCAHGSGHHALG